MSNPLDNPDTPEADEFLIVGPGRLLGDEAAQQRLADRMTALFPGRTFTVHGNAPIMADELVLIPMMGSVGTLPGGEVGGIRRRPGAETMREMQEALEREGGAQPSTH